MGGFAFRIITLVARKKTLCVCVHVCVCVSVHACMHVHACMCARACVCVCARVCVCVCVGLGGGESREENNTKCREANWRLLLQSWFSDEIHFRSAFKLYLFSVYSVMTSMYFLTFKILFLFQVYEMRTVPNFFSFLFSFPFPFFLLPPFFLPFFFLYTHVVYEESESQRG